MPTQPGRGIAAVRCDPQTCLPSPLRHTPHQLAGRTSAAQQRWGLHMVDGQHLTLTPVACEHHLPIGSAREEYANIVSEVFIEKPRAAGIDRRG